MRKAFMHRVLVRHVVGRLHLIWPTLNETQRGMHPCADECRGLSENHREYRTRSGTWLTQLTVDRVIRVVCRIHIRLTLLESAP